MKRSVLRSALLCAVVAGVTTATQTAHADLVTVSISYTGTVQGDPTVQDLGVSLSFATEQLDACEASGDCYNITPPGSIETLGAQDGFNFGTLDLTVYSDGFSIYDFDQRAGIGITDLNPSDIFDLRHSVRPFTGPFGGGPLIQDCEFPYCPDLIPGGGYLTSISDTGVGEIDVTPEATTVTPEPGTWVMVGTGLVGCLGAVRRRLGR